MKKLQFNRTVIKSPYKKVTLNEYRASAMSDLNLSVKKINKLLDDFRQDGKEPEKLLIGYKTYARLMTDDKFAEKVTPSPLDPKERLYKNLKIKLSTEKHYFEVK